MFRFRKKQETISLDPTLSAREHLAKSVVRISIFGTLALAFVTIYVGYIGLRGLTGEVTSSKPPVDIALHVFQSVLAIVGTWVGTVLAFYFSRENFVTVAATTRKLVGELSDHKLGQASVRNVMIPYSRIMGMTMTEGMSENEITLDKLLAMIKPHGVRVPLLTRLPIFSADQRIKYVLHQSTLYEYLVDKGQKVTTEMSTRDATLMDLLNHKDLRAEVERFAFVPIYSSLADAKAAMDKIDGCLDVFVTRSGDPDEPVLGWISDAEISRYGRDTEPL